jgi:signal transduction histidine kinase
MRPLRIALVPLGIAFGIAAEWIVGGAFDASSAADLVVGCVLVACGSLGWDRRPASRVGALLCATGFAWFLGTLFEPALFLHRGPLVHLLLSYPSGRLPSRLARVVTVAAYADGALEPLARNDAVTLALSAIVLLVAVHTFIGTSGPARKGVGLALAATAAFTGVLVVRALDRLADQNFDPDAVLAAYELVVTAVAIILVVALLGGRWSEAVVTGLVVDLGTPAAAGTLRAKLARALGDPSLVIAYRVGDDGAFVDDAGRPVTVPSPGAGTVATPIDDREETVAFLIHDEALLADRHLLDSVAAAARFALENARLQAEAQARAAELDASRRRIVEVGDAQRRRLEQELRLGSERRLERVGALLEHARGGGCGDADAIAALGRDLATARHELREFAQGVHPAALTDHGLRAALQTLAERAPLPVVVNGALDRLPPPLEAAIFFVCSEALANVAKHAAASRAAIDLAADRDRLLVSIVDDGVGGASPGRGSGLAGLADRVDALGGRLSVDSPVGGGTRVAAEFLLRG